MHAFKSLALALLLTAVTTTAIAQDVKPYKDGPVMTLGYIRTKSGKFDEYMKFLDTSYKAQMEAYKKAGLITSYAVYAATPRTPTEPDIILTTVYANMAALDKTDEFDRIDATMAGGMAAQNKGASDRDAIREVLGNDMIREMILK